MLFRCLAGNLNVEFRFLFRIENVESVSLILLNYMSHKRDTCITSTLTFLALFQLNESSARTSTSTAADVAAKIDRLQNAVSDYHFVNTLFVL